MAVLYDIVYTKASDKFFKKHEEIRKKYKNAIAELIDGEHPEKVDVKRIKGKRNYYYRIRLDDWQVIYTVINGQIVTVMTSLAGSRGDVYKKMDGLQ